MTVYREGRGTFDGAEETITKHLRPILITVDDLESLMEIINQYGQDAKKSEVIFKGGTFDAAQDLVKLTRKEMESLRVVSKNIEINLSGNYADIVAPEGVADHISEWAERRRTRRLSSFWKAQLVKLSLLLYVLNAAIFGLTFVPFIPRDETPRFLLYPLMASSPLIFAAGCIIILTTCSSYAVIQPRTLSETRERNDTYGRHFQIWAVSTGVLITATATLILKYIFRD